jgi:hypothetical protein
VFCCQVFHHQLALHTSNLDASIRLSRPQSNPFNISTTKVPKYKNTNNATIPRETRKTVNQGRWTLINGEVKREFSPSIWNWTLKYEMTCKSRSQLYAEQVDSHTSTQYLSLEKYPSTSLNAPHPQLPNALAICVHTNTVTK